MRVLNSATAAAMAVAMAAVPMAAQAAEFASFGPDVLEAVEGHIVPFTKQDDMCCSRIVFARSGLLNATVMVVLAEAVETGWVRLSQPKIIDSVNARFAEQGDMHDHSAEIARAGLLNSGVMTAERSWLS